jgi:hypothetical protein
VASLARERSTQVTFTAWGRAAPRLIGGVSGVMRSPYHTVDTVPATGIGGRAVIAPVNLAGDTVAVLHSRDWRVDFTPVVGVDFPLRARWTGVRTSVGASLVNPTSHWFAGISLPQMWERGHEALPLDLQLVVSASRRTRVRRPDACEFSDGEACGTWDRFRIEGLGLMGTFDGSGLISSLIGALTP